MAPTVTAWVHTTFPELRTGRAINLGITRLGASTCVGQLTSSLGGFLYRLFAKSMSALRGTPRPPACCGAVLEL
jgi:hypothetical protein